MSLPTSLVTVTDTRVPTYYRIYHLHLPTNVLESAKAKNWIRDDVVGIVWSLISQSGFDEVLSLSGEDLLGFISKEINYSESQTNPYVSLREKSFVTSAVLRGKRFLEASIGITNLDNMSLFSDHLSSCLKMFYGSIGIMNTRFTIPDQTLWPQDWNRSAHSFLLRHLQKDSGQEYWGGIQSENFLSSIGLNPLDK